MKQYTRTFFILVVHKHTRLVFINVGIALRTELQHIHRRHPEARLDL